MNICTSYTYCLEFIASIISKIMMMKFICCVLLGKRYFDHTIKIIISKK